MTKISKMMMLLLFVFALNVLWGKTTSAQTIKAASCGSSDVQAALNSVSADGTIVNIPVGTCNWTTPVTYNQVHSTTIMGQSTIIGTCMPGGSCSASDSTIITDNISGTALTINTASGKSFRMTGLTFNPSSGTAAYGAIDISGNSTAVRVDHNHFNDTVGGDHTIQIDHINGVFDHNFFDSTNQSLVNFFQATDNGPDGEANLIWTQPENFGTSQHIFFENNLFQNGHFAFDCDFGGHIVFRYNIGGTLIAIQTHGVGSGAQRRGCRAMEVYNNTFTYTSTPNTSSFFALVDYESGTGLWWGNTITGFVTVFRQQEVRANNATYAQSTTPGGWGYCGSAFSGTGSNWDQDSNGSTGYHCLDQIGSGAGDLLTGSFPNLVNSTTGTIAWPHQAAVPTYTWMNTQVTNSYAPNHYWQNYESPARPVENTDYYLQLPNADEGASFNGTAGTGFGLLSARPSTCTPKVAYWATDTATLYQCASANSWAAYYTPYTYPHPLTQSLGSGTAPLPPTQLLVIIH